MTNANFKTPGVYIKEVSAFPKSLIPFPTAAPAFIRYALQVKYEGKSFLNRPKKITSMAEFETYFMLLDVPPSTELVAIVRPAEFIEIMFQLKWRGRSWR